MDIEKEITTFMPLHDFNFNINISLKNKYVYFEVAKAACSTIKKRLLNYEVSPFDASNIKLHHDIFSSPFVKPYQLNKKMLRHVLFSGEYFRFSFVREPYVRVLSAYLDKIVRLKPQAKKVLRALNITFDDEAFSNIDISFEQFILSIEKTPVRRLDKHWRPQHMLLMHPFINLDFTGKIESFNDGWNSVISRIGLTNDTGENVLWHQTNAKENLSQHYTSNFRDRINKIYRLDFETYGYNRNL